MAVFGICLRRQMKMGSGTQYECTLHMHAACYQLFYRAQLWNGKIANKIKWKALFRLQRMQHTLISVVVHKI